MEVKALLAGAAEGIRSARSVVKPRNSIEEDALRWRLYISLQNLLDAAAVLLVELGLRKPSSYADIGKVLSEAGFAIDVDSFKLVAATRNALAHAYRRLSPTDLSRIADEVLPRAEALITALEEICDRAEVDPQELEELQGLEKVFEKAGAVAAYIFGSRARGTARQDSDYDIAVLFNKPVTVMDEIRLAIEISDAIGVPADKVDVVALDIADDVLKARVLREGKLIYIRDRETLKAWERKTYMEILHNADLHAIYSRRK